MPIGNGTQLRNFVEGNLSVDAVVQPSIDLMGDYFWIFVGAIIGIVTYNKTQDAGTTGILLVIYFSAVTVATGSEMLILVILALIFVGILMGLMNR